MVSETFKTDLLTNPWGICGSIADLKAKNSEDSKSVILDIILDKQSLV